MQAFVTVPPTPQHLRVCACVRPAKKVTVGHSQESLIWTGSATIEVRGHVGQGVEVSKPITGQCVSEGPSNVK